MNVSSLLATPWHGGLEYDSDSLQQLDPAPAPYWLYPDQHQFHPAHSDTILHAYLEAAQHASRANRSTRPPATLCLTQLANAGETQFNPDVADQLDDLKHEIGLQGDTLGNLFQINQLQLRGTRHLASALPDMLQHVQQHFLLSPTCVREIEVIAGGDTEAELPQLRASGFTHLQLLLRHQSFCASQARNISRLIRQARDLCFASVSVTLEYGHSPHTMLGLARIVKSLLEAGPDRIALRLADSFNPASCGVPDAASVAAARTQLCWCIRHLNAAQYYYLGNMIFARPHDALVRAQILGRLHRNLFGYTSLGENNHIGCGPGAISCLGNYYSQNHTAPAIYHQKLHAGYLPLAREMHLNMDDLLRRIIIHMLLCNFELSIAALELAYPICFHQYFADELQRLKAMAQQNWLVIDDESLLVLSRGRLFINRICAIFDHYQSTAEPK